MVIREASRSASAEQRLNELGIELPAPPEPFGSYLDAVQAGTLLFLSGMLPTEGHAAKFIGRVGAELDVEAGRSPTSVICAPRRRRQRRTRLVWRATWLTN